MDSSNNPDQYSEVVKKFAGKFKRSRFSSGSGIFEKKEIIQSKSLSEIFIKILDEEKIDEDVYKSLHSKLKHLNFFKLIEKELLESLLKYMTLYKPLQGEIICSSKFNNESFSIVFLKGDFRLSSNPLISKSIVTAYHKQFIELNKFEEDNEIYSQTGYPYDIIRDLDEDYNFEKLKFQYVYALKPDSEILKIDINACQDLIINYVENKKEQKLKEFLKNEVPRFDTLNNSLLQKFSLMFHERKFKTGQFVIMESESQSSVYVVYSGSLQLTSSGKDSKSKTSQSFYPKLNSPSPSKRVETILVNYGPKQWVNEDCVFSKTPSLFTIKCVTNSVLYEISRENFINKIMNLSEETYNYFIDSINHKKNLFNIRNENSKSCPRSSYFKYFVNSHNLVKNIKTFKSSFPSSVSMFFSPKEISYYKNVQQIQEDRTSKKNINSFLLTKNTIVNHVEFMGKLESVNNLNNKNNLQLMENCTTRIQTLIKNKNKSVDNISPEKHHDSMNSLRLKNLDVEKMSNKILIDNLKKVKPLEMNIKLKQLSNNIYNNILEKNKKTYRNSCSLRINHMELSSKNILKGSSKDVN